MLKSAPSVIHSTQVSRKLLQHADVLISSTRNTALNNCRFGFKILREGLRLKNLNLFYTRGKEDIMKSSNIGGQAVMEGVMMKNADQYSVAVRKTDGEIIVKTE